VGELTSPRLYVSQENWQGVCQQLADAFAMARGRSRADGVYSIDQFIEDAVSLVIAYEQQRIVIRQLNGRLAALEQQVTADE
jgi:hypothetical protein